MKRVVFIVLLLSGAFVLQGCVAAVIGAGAGTTKLVTDPRTTGTQVDDTTLDSKIGMKLKDEAAYFEGARIVVSAYNTNVLLIGQAKSDSQISRAVELAQSVSGVNKIYNQIRIGTVISTGVMTNDAWITTKVKTNLIGNSNTKARNIKVVTENGEVFLRGIVTRQEGQLASEVASKVDGVKLVTTVFTYLD